MTFSDPHSCLKSLFLSPKHPFYQSTDIVSLRTIDRAVYLEFARRFFVNKRKPFDDEAFCWFYDRFDGITWYVQMVLRQLWTEGRGLPDAASALKDLQSCDLVYRTDRGFVVYDRFFGLWLSRLPR